MSVALASSLAIASLLAISVANAVAAPPTAVTDAPAITKISGTNYKVTFKGTVNPNGVASTYYFEWGPTAAYGIKSTEMSAGSGSSPVNVSWSAWPVPEGTIYHYRIVAKNKDGTTFGADKALKTELIPSWSLQSTPNPHASVNQLKDVSCLSGGECFAVGNTAITGPLVQRWNGTEWKTQGSGTTFGAGLESISCTSTTACIAVGYQTVSGSKVALAMGWDGTSWKAQALPEYVNTLKAVSCQSATNCMAVSSGTIGARWDGVNWTKVLQFEPLEDVSCVSATFCMAVGDAPGGESGAPTSKVWNGSSWTKKETPSGYWLKGVSCTSSTACTAVGSKPGPGVIGMAPLVARWNGTAWSAQEAPSAVAVGRNVLEGVSCSSATVCVATGWAEDESFAVTTLVERWNGSFWDVQSSPNPEGTRGFLTDVSCISSLICESVGYSNSSKGVLLTLAERSS